MTKEITKFSETSKPKGNEDLKKKVEEFKRANMKLYLDLQIELYVKKFGNRDKVDEHYEEIGAVYSEEYAEAFDKVIGERMAMDEFFTAKLISREELLAEIQSKMDLMYGLEKELMTKSGDDELLIWHSKYGMDYINLIHGRPELLLRYKTAMDTEPRVKAELIDEIE